MKLNNRGVTLIESIITIAMIVILLGTIGVAFTNVIHYMGESSLIKNTSNDVFEKIQNNEGNESTAVMRFNDTLSVNVSMRTVTEKYNDNEELSLSCLNIDTSEAVFNQNANFYLLIDPLDQGKENNPSFHLYTDTYCVNDVDYSTPNHNSVLAKTVASTDLDYISQHIKAPLKTNEKVMAGINNILKGELYKNVNYDQTEIVWYKIDKKDNDSFYDVYGYVKPYKKSGKNVTFTFRWNSWHWIGSTIHGSIVKESDGFNNRLLTFVKNELESNPPINGLKLEPDKYYFQNEKIYNNRKFYLNDLLDNSIFDNLSDGDEIVIECYLK